MRTFSTPASSGGVESPTGPDGSRPDDTGPDGTGPDGTRPDDTGPGTSDPGGPIAEPAARAPRVGHLERSSIYVLLNTAATGSLGAVFWLVAARYSSEEDVAAAVAAAAILIGAAFLCQLNLPTALSRFLPGAGPHQTALVTRSYRASLGASVAIGAVVLAVGLARGGAVVEGGSLLLTVALAVSVPVWTIFALQDNVLVTLRESKWVPIENTVTTVAKYGLLPLLVGLGGGAGILIAWTGPSLAGVLVVTWYLFARVLPRSSAPSVPDDASPDNAGPDQVSPAQTGPVQTNTDPTGPDRTAPALIGARPFFSYAMRDFPGATLQMLSLRLVPILVLELGEPADGAFIGLPWTVLTVAVLVLPMLSRALLSELSHDESAADSLMSRATRLVLFGMLPATAIGALFVGPFLSVAGAEYADRGTPILAWGALGLAPAAYVECRLALLRFQHRVLHAGIFMGVQAIALLVATFALILGDRVRDLGLAFVIVQVVAALTIGAFARAAERWGYRGEHLTGAGRRV